jgi:hypothetical protein
VIPTEWTPVDSSHVVRMKYDPHDTDTKNGVQFVSPSLHVEFATGKQYKFKDVNAFKAESLFHHPSPGKYFGEAIRGWHDSEEIK